MTVDAAIDVDLIALHHHYCGRLATHGSRLSDFLSDPRSEFVGLFDVRIVSAGCTANPIQCEQVKILKERLLIVIPSQSSQAPGQRLDKFQKKQRYGAVVVLPGHVLSGVLQLPAMAKPSTVLEGSDGCLSPFFGLTEVTFHHSVFRLTPETAPVAIVRRDAIEGLEVSAKAFSPPGESPLGAAPALH